MKSKRNFKVGDRVHQIADLTAGGNVGPQYQLHALGTVEHIEFDVAYPIYVKFDGCEHQSPRKEFGEIEVYTEPKS